MGVKAELTTTLWRSRIVLPLMLTLLVCLPFLNKPFHIDDQSFLAVTDQILINPFEPHSRVYDQDGHLDYLFGISSSPLISYLYAAVEMAFGRSEVTLHLAMMLFYLMLFAGTTLLSGRFANGSALPVLFVAFSPAIITSGNLMMDIPAAGCATLGVALFIQGCDRQDTGRLLTGSLLAGCAILAKYSAIILLPLLAIYILLFATKRYLLFLLVSLLPLSVWFTQNLLVHGMTHIQFLLELSSGESAWPDHLLNGFAVLGSSLYLALLLPIAALLVRQPRVVAISLAGAVAAAMISLVYFDEINTWQFWLWSSLGGTTTALVLFALVQDLMSDNDTDRKETLFLACWIGAIAFFSVFQVYFQAVRHVLPMLVPVALILVRSGQRLSPTSSTRNALAALLLVTQGVIAYWVAIADYAYANSYRTGVAEIEALHPEANIWFAGTWGFKYYAERSGWKMLSPENNTPAPGDIIVIPQQIQKLNINKPLAAVQIAERVADNPWGLATMNGWQGAGFYAALDNTLPYLFAPGTPHEIFRVYRSLPAPAEN